MSWKSEGSGSGRNNYGSGLQKPNRHGSGSRKLLVFFCVSQSIFVLFGVADPECFFQICIFPSRKIFYLALGNMIRVVYPESRIPDPDFFPSQIRFPDRGVKKNRIRNTGFYSRFLLLRASQTVYISTDFSFPCDPFNITYFSGLSHFLCLIELRSFLLQFLVKI